ncbi:hypothetical protein PR048_002223, partial [Dryococelus australis]
MCLLPKLTMKPTADDKDTINEQEAIGEPQIWYGFGTDLLPQNHNNLKMLWILITSAVKLSSQ